MRPAARVARPPASRIGELTASFASDSERFRVDVLSAVAKAKLLVGLLWKQPEADFAFHRGPAERLVRAVRNAARWLFKRLAGR